MKKLRNSLKNPAVNRLLAILVFICFIVLLNWIVIFKLSEQEYFLKNFISLSKSTFFKRFSKGFLSIEIPSNISKEQQHDCDVILNTLMLGISDLNEGFSDFIELEVKWYVYKYSTFRP